MTTHILRYTAAALLLACVTAQYSDTMSTQPQDLENFPTIDTSNEGNAARQAAEEMDELPEDAAVYDVSGDTAGFHCCAMHGHGHYYANISISGFGSKAASMEEEIDVNHGYVAVNADTQQFAISVGSFDIRHSPFGWYAGYCNSKKKAYAAAWNKKSCKVYELKKGVPKMCFGADSYYPVFDSTVRVDMLTRLVKFRDEKGWSKVAINPLTCMPYWKWMQCPKMWEENMIRGAASGGRLYVVMQNATAEAPHHDKFGVPARCADQLNDAFGL